MKKIQDLYNHLDRIPSVSDRQTDGQTSCHFLVRAMHTRRAVKSIYILLNTKYTISILSSVLNTSILNTSQHCTRQGSFSDFSRFTRASL